MEMVYGLQSIGWEIGLEDIVHGLESVVALTGLKGRWQLLQQDPKMICDTGHNIDGVRMLVKQLNQQTYKQLWMVWGAANDKDLDPILALLPKSAKYLFCQADVPRALKAEELATKAKTHGLVGEVVPSVKEAIAKAKAAADPGDLIFIGGSTFVVAEIEEL
ncbi:glutamate ligase domain-containing protein [Persicobacter sp. CCB-QB2]|uniref:glutamate ligase domain-containing protein n=1 Tax=Persicobacter sp. CCB-QB2 TaxID=1561025 RepID=UPI000A62591A